MWPQEIEDRSETGRLHLLAKLRRALRAERRRARANHWSYDLNRHLGLLSVYKSELADLAAALAELSGRDRNRELRPARRVVERKAFQRLRDASRRRRVVTEDPVYPAAAVRQGQAQPK